MQFECFRELFVFGEDRQLAIMGSAEEHSTGGTAEFELALVYRDGECGLSIAKGIGDDFTSIDGDLSPRASAGYGRVKDSAGEGLIVEVHGWSKLCIRDGGSGSTPWSCCFCIRTLDASAVRESSEIDTLSPRTTHPSLVGKSCELESFAPR